MFHYAGDGHVSYAMGSTYAHHVNVKIWQPVLGFWYVMDI